MLRSWRSICRRTQQQIILNFPVKDLNRSKAFLSALGFTFNEQLSGENAAFMNVAFHV
ncbi:hypothetical protein SAMN05518865_101471 [Duganella sp. CF458]|uniref:VOC family protein n=1 Tax=Duganella sp. CF458 TaxID=1884368 RepID=UPI0008F41158|nr:hypothetical protein SAMN05518865_101471 [Duganella sp. CF458]